MNNQINGCHCRSNLNSTFMFGNISTTIKLYIVSDTAAGEPGTPDQLGGCSFRGTENTSKRSHKNDEKCGNYTFDGTLWELKAKGMTWSQC